MRVYRTTGHNRITDAVETFNIKASDWKEAICILAMSHNRVTVDNKDGVPFAGPQELLYK